MALARPFVANQHDKPIVGELRNKGVRSLWCCSRPDAEFLAFLTHPASSETPNNEVQPQTESSEADYAYERLMYSHHQSVTLAFRLAFGGVLCNQKPQIEQDALKPRSRALAGKLLQQIS